MLVWLKIERANPKHEICRSTLQSTSMLALKHPVENFEELRSQLDSVDFVRA
jgi:hypothetical protein